MFEPVKGNVLRLTCFICEENSIWKVGGVEKCKVLPHPKSSLHIWIWQLSYFSKWDAKFSSHCNLETQLEKQFQSLSHDDHHHMFVCLSLNFMEPFPRVLIIKQFSTWLKFIIFFKVPNWHANNFRCKKILLKNFLGFLGLSKNCILF